MLVLRQFTGQDFFKAATEKQNVLSLHRKLVTVNSHLLQCIYLIN